MLATRIMTFVDPEQARAAFRGAVTDYKVIEPGQFYGRLTVVNAGSLLLQRAEERLGRIARIAVAPDVVGISAWLSPPPIVRGRQMLAGEFMYYTPGTESLHRTGRDNDAVSLQMSPACLDSTAIALTGRPIELRSPQAIRPPPQAAQRFMSLVGRVTQAAETGGTPSGTESAYAATEALTRALVTCLTAADASEERTTTYHQARIMARFVEAVDASVDQPLYMTDLCRDLAVSGRALRAYCHEHLGISPHRFLLLRRMHLAHSALLHASPGSTTVTEIATRFGFWELGRFAVAYRALFGASPSVTLRCAG